jgi:signal transduction histidine kinase
MLWYGGLVAVSLIVFGILVYFLAVEAIYQEAQNAVNAETRIALLDIEHTLTSDSNSWRSGLMLSSIEKNIDPTIGVEVIDTHGQVLYRSTRQFVDVLPEHADIVQAARTGQPQTKNASVQHIPVLLKVSPIYAPVTGADGKTNPHGPIIGTLVVVKSLEEATSTLLLLQTLLLLAGLTALTIALAGGWAITTNVLRPLAEIVKTARAIATTARGTHVGNLNQRVRRPHGHDELVQVVDTFNEMLAALERATQAQHRFIADASHELRAPLTTVQGNLAFLQRHLDEIPPDERRTMLRDAYGETLRLARLVDELLLLARADTDNDYKPITTKEKHALEAKKSQHERPVELDRALLQLVRQLRGRLNMDGSRLKLEIGHIEPVRVYGDEENLRRVMLILLDNALKYTPADDEKESGRVTVALERDGKDAVLHVKDTGIGIDPNDLPHIFERFYRADRARTRQGTGLGLSIAHTLVEQAGGRITAESTPGEGSTFSVWLPLVK